MNRPVFLSLALQLCAYEPLPVRGSLDTACSFHLHLPALPCVSDHGIRVRQVVPPGRLGHDMRSGTKNTRRLISSDLLLVNQR